MTAILATAAAVAAVVILGAYLRWAAQPMLVGYRAGVAVGRLTGAKQDGKHSAPVAGVAAAWLMPGRAARRIREQRRDISLLIRTLAYAVTGGAEPLVRERPARSDWYDRPLPIAVLAALLRPARAVRKLRSADDATAWMLDAMLAQERKHHSDTGPQLAATGN